MPIASLLPQRDYIAGVRTVAASSGFGEPVHRPGLQPTLSAVAHSLCSNRASDGRQGPEPQAFRDHTSKSIGEGPFFCAESLTKGHRSSSFRSPPASSTARRRCCRSAHARRSGRPEVRPTGFSDTPSPWPAGSWATHRWRPHCQAIVPCRPTPERQVPGEAQAARPATSPSPDPRYHRAAGTSPRPRPTPADTRSSHR